MNPPWSTLNFTEMSNKFLMRGVDPGVLRRRTAVAQVQAASARCGPGTTIPADWDWTSAKAGGNVFPVRPSQGACGSCWAQAAIAALESRAMIDGVNAGPNLSEDQLLGCVNAANGYRSRGCGGGLAEEALDYISRQFAADEQTYAGTPGSGCKTNATRRSNAVSLVSSPGWRPVASLAEAIRRAVYCEGPVIVYLQVEESFAYYQGGIYPAAACKAVSGTKTFNHAMVVVGYSFGKNRYFKVRNSWGSSWGQGGVADLGGHVLIEATSDAAGPCGLYRYPLVPTQSREAGPQLLRPSPPPPRAFDFSLCRQGYDVAGQALPGMPLRPDSAAACLQQCDSHRAAGCAAAVFFGKNATCYLKRFAPAIRPSQDVQEMCYLGSSTSWRSRKFVDPSLNNIPISVCPSFDSNYPEGCGKPAADAFCRRQGFVSAQDVGPWVPSGRPTICVLDGARCLSGCTTLAYVICGAGSVCTCGNLNVSITQLASGNGRYSLELQSNRNIVLSQLGAAALLWQSNTGAQSPQAPLTLVLQTDGNLVGYEGPPGNSAAFWSSQTDGKGQGPYRLAVQNNGNIVLYDGQGRPLWSTATAEPFDHYFKRNWIGLAASTDGKWLATADSGGAWWVSSDSGRSWRNEGGYKAWTAVAMSADGNMRFAAARGNFVLFTANNWTNAVKIGLGARQWSSISCSATGNQLVAADRGGSLWKATFNVSDPAQPRALSTVQLTSAGAHNWSSVAMGADGVALLAVADTGLLFYSGDGGVSWGSRTLICGDGNTFPWVSTAIGGSLQMAAKSSEYLWFNYGQGSAGWGSNAASMSSLSPWRAWSSLSLANSGARISVAAAVTGGGIHTTRFYYFDPPNYGADDLREVATGTTGSQAWSGVAVSPTDALVAVAPNSPWGIYHSDDGRLWMPRMRGLRMQTFKNLSDPAYPANYTQLTPSSNSVVPVPTATGVADYTAVLFTGSLIVHATGSYHIWLGSDDGSRLWLDGQVVIGNGGLHQYLTKDAVITMGAGWHTLRLEYFQWTGGNGLLLEWERPQTGSRQAIASDYLSPVQI